MLELHNLHVQLASAQVLRGLSLSVLPGQMVGLLGRNGAGKTSTMRSIMGHLALQQGRMQFEGQDLSAMPPQARAAIDKHSGLTLTEKLGQATQGQWQYGYDLVKDRLVTLAPDEEKTWQAALAPVAQKWAEGAPNGPNVLEAFRAEVRALRKK
jgi:ABC-type glutathione transport system ATPase component